MTLVSNLGVCLTQAALEATCWFSGMAGHAAAGPADGVHASDMSTDAAAAARLVSLSCVGVLTAFVAGGLGLRSLNGRLLSTITAAVATFRLAAHGAAADMTCAMVSMYM
jgi:hypothetical protein